MNNGRTETPLGLLSDLRRRDRDILLIQRPRVEVTGFVLDALQQTRDETKLDVTEFRKALEPGGQTENIAKATARLNGLQLDPTERLLLSIPEVYAKILQQALDLGDEFKLEDTTGLANFVLRELNDPAGPRRFFVGLLLASATKKNGINLTKSQGELLAKRLMNRELATREDKVEAQILEVVSAHRQTGNYDRAIDIYARSGEIGEAQLTPAVRKAMIAHLQRLGVQLVNDGILNVDGIEKGQFDEYFALAYNQARSGGADSGDPIDAVRQKGFVVDLSFDVDQFDGAEDQGVIPENIMAAGMLDYIYNLGERLGIFRLADQVVLKWGSGAIDLDPGATPAKLYRYWKLRNERTSPEERGTLYTRVLSKGEGELVEGMVANEAFPGLWGNLMTAVGEYITRTEEKKTEERSISRQPIYQATRQLQYNLTEFTTGMAHMQISEMYHHLQEARGILEDPQITDFFGSGRRKTIWTVIDRGSKEWFGNAPNIAAIRDCAVQGNRVFQWIANFDQATVTDQDFMEFRDAAESWILAQAADSGEVPATVGAPEEATDDDATAGVTKDDFDADWDK